jgi:hypothetical protein
MIYDYDMIYDYNMSVKQTTERFVEFIGTHVFFLRIWTTNGKVSLGTGRVLMWDWNGYKSSRTSRMKY